MVDNALTHWGIAWDQASTRGNRAGGTNDASYNWALDIADIVDALHVVDNNTPTTIGGGSTTDHSNRRASLICPIGTAGSGETCSGGGSSNPPAAPSSLNASVVSSSQIDISWSDNSSNENGFKIERKTGAGGTYSEIATVANNTTSYSNTGLSATTTYVYRVRAYNGDGSSSYTGEASATTQSAGGTLPTAPSSLSASVVSSSQIDISWSDNSSNENGFKIERKTGASGTYNEIATVGNSTTSFSNTGLSAATTYVYRVRAYNAAGNSAYTGEASATTQSAGGNGSVTVGVVHIGKSTQNGSKGSKYGVAEVSIEDNQGNAVGNAMVTGTFSGDFNEIITATTASYGTATFITSNSKKGGISFEFCVDNITHNTLTYDPNSNIINCSNGSRLSNGISDELEAYESKLSVYPNPAVGILNFSETVSGVIYSMDGSRVAALKNVTSYKTDRMKAGVYLFRRDTGQFLRVQVK